MAAIDLKNATIKIKDGYDGPGGTPEVNNVAGYPIGTTTMLVDGFVGAVANFDYFSVVGDATTLHQITAHTETTGNTTSITFTPALGGAVIDNADITIHPHQLEVTVGEGNLTYSEKRNMEYIKDRGVLDTVREGDEEPVEVSLDFTWEFLTASSGEEATIEDALKKRGGAASWESSSADTCEPYAVILEIFYNPPCSDEENERITLSDFRWETLDHDSKEGSVSTSGKCNIKEATVARTTAVF